MESKWKKAVVGMGFMGLILVTSGCVSSMPTATQVKVPTPIEGNSGKYMCPFTSDDTVTEWVTTGMKASLGSSVGSAAGAYAGQKALEQVPFVGGFLGAKAGGAVGRAIAIKASGGMEAIKEKSDISFNSIDDLGVYMYAKYSMRPDYQKVYKLTCDIYPELKTRYYPAIKKARSS